MLYDTFCVSPYIPALCRTCQESIPSQTIRDRNSSAPTSPPDPVEYSTAGCPRDVRRSRVRHYNLVSIKMVPCYPYVKSFYFFLCHFVSILICDLILISTLYHRKISPKSQGKNRDLKINFHPIQCSGGLVKKLSPHREQLYTS